MQYHVTVGDAATFSVDNRAAALRLAEHIRRAYNRTPDDVVVWSLDGHGNRTGRVTVLPRTGHTSPLASGNAPGTLPVPASPYNRLRAIAKIIEDVDTRCLSVDGPVTPTTSEITGEELRRIYDLAAYTPELARPEPAAPGHLDAGDGSTEERAAARLALVALAEAAADYPTEELSIIARVAADKCSPIG